MTKIGPNPGMYDDYDLQLFAAWIFLKLNSMARCQWHDMTICIHLYMQDTDGWMEWKGVSFGESAARAISFC